MSGSEEMAGYDYKALVQELYGAFGRGDIPAILGMLTDSIDWNFYGPEEFGFTGPHSGKAEVGHFFEQVVATHNVTAFEPREFYSDGSTVIVVGYEEATSPKGDQSIASNWVHVWDFEGGKISRLRGFVDTAAFAQALLPR